MRYTLKPYQAEAVGAILDNLGRARRMYQDAGEPSSFALTASTGGGKTVISAAVIEALFFGSADFDFAADRGAVVLWFSDDPDLNEQSRARIMAAAPELGNRTRVIEPDFVADSLLPGTIYFLNAQKLSKNARLVRGVVEDPKGQGSLIGRPDNAQHTIYDVLAETMAGQGRTLYMFLDEAHRGMQTTSKDRVTTVQRLIGGQPGIVDPMPVVMGLSATVERFDKAMARVQGRARLDAVEVSMEAVRESGLVKDGLILDFPGETGEFGTTLLRDGVKLIRESEAAWNEYTYAQGDIAPVEPLLIVQVPDLVDETYLKKTLDTIFEAWPELPTDAVAHVFGERRTIMAGPYAIHHIEPQYIQGATYVRVLLAKTAITTGWDCPRAEVLVSFRTAVDPTHVTQMLGRMVRTPLARRVPGDAVLNSVHCILPLYDEKAAKKVADALQAPNAGEDDGAWGWSAPEEEDQAEPTTGTEPGTHGTSPVTPPHAGQRDEGTTNETAHTGTPQPTTPGSVPSPGTPGATREVSHRITPSTTGGIRTTSVFLTPITLYPNQAIAGDVWDSFDALPTYALPRGSAERPTHRLITLATAFAIDATNLGLPEARGYLATAHRQMNALLDGQRIEHADAFAEALDDVETMKGTRLVRDFTTGQDQTSEYTIAADAASIRDAFNASARKFGSAIATDYVKHLVAQADDDDFDYRDAEKVVAALGRIPEVVEAVRRRADDIARGWLTGARAALKGLSDERQAVYEDLTTQSTRPELTSIRRPKSLLAERMLRNKEGDTRKVPTYLKNLLSDEHGNAPSVLNEWEHKVVTTEIDRATTVAWYRNPDRGSREAVVVPFREGETASWRGLRPDFVFFTRMGDGAIRPSIVDPHGTYFADALPKLQGLANYAVKHGSEFLRIEAVAKVQDGYRVLDLSRPAIRAAIAETAPTESSIRALYLSHGEDYR